MSKIAEPQPNALRPVNILAGTVLGVAISVSPPPEGFDPAAWKVLGVAIWMAFWWLTEAVPVAVTALMPLVAFPVLGVFSFKAAAAPYAHPLIFLFMGGFIIARAIETWNLHRRIALMIVKAFGTRPDYLIAGFMLATALLHAAGVGLGFLIGMTSRSYGAGIYRLAGGLASVAGVALLAGYL